MDAYQQFLENKTKKHVLSGFDIDEANLNEQMFPFQKFIVRRALRAGKYAIFADCGLGKTLMQIEWANQVYNHTKKPVLILAPLAVAGQTIKEGEKFDIRVTRASYDSRHPHYAPIQIANYEQINNIDCSIYAGVVLDESSILKNFEGATKKLIVDTFQNTPYKLACTATPSPNDPMELGNHAEFLNVMSYKEMLAMYFVHDGGETAKWRLKKHAHKIFYHFVGTWAIMLNKPQDIGFNMDGYALPNLNLLERQVITPKRDNGQLFNDAAISATNFNAELRITKLERAEQVVGIVNNSTENFIIWVKHNEESEYLRSLIPDAVEVKGSDDAEYKEAMLLGFAENKFRVLITKTKIAQFGLNYQNCRNQVFASLDFSFEGLYQAIRRSYRFGQKNEVNIYLITTDTMSNVKQTIDTKQKQFEIMQHEMNEAINENLSGTETLVRVYDSKGIETSRYQMQRGDCVQLIKAVPDASVGLSVFSPPFADLYTYSDAIEDMGNSKDYNEFLEQFGYLVKELHRVLIPGRNVAVHCMDLPIQKGKEGFIGLRDFSGLLLDAFCGKAREHQIELSTLNSVYNDLYNEATKNGDFVDFETPTWLLKKINEVKKKINDAGDFIYHSRITIWKDPVVEMQRTKALGLLHKQVKKDSTMSRVGIPDYVLVFRKDGERINPVKNEGIPVDLWQKYASPVWMDIDYGDTLQGFRNGRDESDEKHICPLQLPTVERLIHLYSNEGDTVLTPFMGIGTEVYQAVKMNRNAIGFELKESYFDLAKTNLKALELSKTQQSLF